MKSIFFKTIIKKTLFIFAIISFTAASSFAQRIASVDVNLILESMNEYQNAQKELDKSASAWRQDIAQEYDKIKGMYNRYQAEQVLMSDEMKKQKEDEIMKKEKEVREMQKSKFGPEGALFKKRQELVRPIQDKVYGAIQEYAEGKGFDFIFDKGGSSGIIFSNERYDKTKEVMSSLGIN